MSENVIFNLKVLFLCLLFLNGITKLSFWNVHLTWLNKFYKSVNLQKDKGLVFPYVLVFISSNSHWIPCCFLGKISGPTVGSILSDTFYETINEFINQRGLVDNEQLQVPENAGENLCHQILHGVALDNAIPYIHYICQEYDEWE